MTTEKMNTENMTLFLAQVSAAHKEEFIVMVLDGASSHRGKDLVIPKNVTLIRLPPYSPELNPAEQIWNILRRNYFANRVFDSLDIATAQAEFGLAEMAANKNAVSNLTNWPWIRGILNTKYNKKKRFCEISAKNVVESRQRRHGSEKFDTKP
jgi:transposase